MAWVLIFNGHSVGDERWSTNSSLFAVVANQNVNNAGSSMPIPFLRGTSLSLSDYLTADGLLDGICSSSRNHICPALDGHGPLGVLPDGNAGSA